MTRRRVFAALALCVAVAASPALLGSWVYDDRLMLGHPALDGLEDLAPAFARTSDDFQAPLRRGPAIAGGATYRPLPMVSFIAVNGTVGPRPLAHHLVSLACHLGVVWLLLGAAGPAVGGRALLAITIFALHPASLEAYGWINGRADVLAGLFLAAMLPLLGAWLPLFAVLVGGGLCKETFFVAAAALVVARAPRPRAALLALVAAVLVVAGARLLAGAGGVAAAPPIGELLGRLPGLVGLGVETLLAPWPRPMRFLAWELGGAPAAAALVPLVVVALLAARRELRRALLVAGAVTALAPTVLVADAFWLGFDRYLYLPGILLVVAVLPGGGGRPWVVAAAVCAAGLGAATFVAARAYGSHEAFAAAVLEARPEDPTGYLLVADDLLTRGRPADAAELLERMPIEGLPPSAAHHGAALLLGAGRPAEAAALVEHAAAEHPDDLDLAFDLLSVRAAQRRWPEVTALVRRLSADGRHRRAVAELVASWGAGAPPEVRAAIR